MEQRDFDAMLRASLLSGAGHGHRLSKPVQHVNLDFADGPDGRTTNIGALVGKHFAVYDALWTKPSGPSAGSGTQVD